MAKVAPIGIQEHAVSQTLVGSSAAGTPERLPVSARMIAFGTSSRSIASYASSRSIASGASSRPIASGDTPSAWIGTVVSHYRIHEQLGGGGMGVVFRAVDEHLDRSVALKFLPPEVSHLKEVKERFIQEAKAASALDHPNICTVYEVGTTDDDQLFIAMAYHPGETLKQRIARGALSVTETVEVMRQIAAGLAESHDHDIVHRDIKPANIWLRSSPESSSKLRSIQVKILDFGLAKVTGKADLTRTGSSMGTPAYMSPEHARGERVDPRTDLWSLGVLTYEALTRQVPFTGGSIPAIMYALLAREPRPLRDLRPEVPPELERIVSRLMRKQASERYASCHEFLDALERAFPGSGTLPPSLSSTEVEAAFESVVADDSATGVDDSPPSSTPSTSPAITPPATGLSPSAPPPEVLEALSPSPVIPEGKTLEMRRPAARRRASLRAVPTPVPEPPATNTAPGDFEAQLARGLEAALARSYEQAVAAFEKALELRPGDPRAQFNLERIRHRLEERDKLQA